jgi:septum formation inhibitor-activating ATPase MinD
MARVIIFAESKGGVGKSYGGGEIGGSVVKCQPVCWIYDTVSQNVWISVGVRRYEVM